MVWLEWFSVSVKWDVNWVPEGRWDYGCLPIGPLGDVLESSHLWCGDRKNGEEPQASHSNGLMV